MNAYYILATFTHYLKSFAIRELGSVIPVLHGKLKLGEKVSCPRQLSWKVAELGTQTQVWQDSRHQVFQFSNAL